MFCIPLTAGAFGEAEEQGRRLMKVPCLVSPTGSNFYAKPIEGLFAVIDLGRKEVLRVVDTGVRPVPAADWGYTDEENAARDGSLRPAANPVALSQPQGPNYRVDGSQVSWDMWRFHLRADKRPGSVLSMVEARDGARWRSVAYQMHLSEVFVPYMDPDQSWYWRAYMDSGEYGFGNFLSPLRKGVDCPSYARFLTVTMPQDDGEPMPKFRTPSACSNESIGDPAWRHYEIFGQLAAKPVPAAGRPASRTRGALGLGGRQLRLSDRLRLSAGRQHPDCRRRDRHRRRQGCCEPIDEGLPRPRPTRAMER